MLFSGYTNIVLLKHKKKSSFTECEVEMFYSLTIEKAATKRIQTLARHYHAAVRNAIN